jgi:ESCRT-II complex subunit VPS36
MDALEAATLTASGRAAFLDGEVELRLYNDVTLLEQREKKVLKDLPLPAGSISLTNYRIIFTGGSGGSGEQSQTVAFSIYLGKVASADDCNTHLLSRSTRARILFNVPSLRHLEIGIRFAGDGKADFLRRVADALKRKSWESMPPPRQLSSSAASVVGVGNGPGGPPTVPAALPTPAFSTANAGLSGIIKKQERELSSVDSLTKQALNDMDALMQHARTVVKVVKDYAAYLEESRGGASGGASSRSGAAGETESETGETNEIETILQEIGIASPVTKFSAGKLFHQQLARQIADILHEGSRLRKLGGMITVTDLFCLVNRARGTELVSPDDLLKSVQCMEFLHVGMRLKRYQSGVLVLQLDSCSEETLCQSILDCIIRNERDTERRLGFKQGMLAFEVSQELKLSLIVTKELLLAAEMRGLLCRDESYQGLAYFSNIFLGIGL